MYSNPPVHGALLVDNILGTPEIKQQWFDEVKGMADRIIDMRTLLQTNLEKSGSSLPWKHVTEQIGMFCFSGISPEQVRFLLHLPPIPPPIVYNASQIPSVLACRSAWNHAGICC